MAEEKCQAEHTAATFRRIYMTAKDIKSGRAGLDHLDIIIGQSALAGGEALRQLRERESAGLLRRIGYFFGIKRRRFDVFVHGEIIRRTTP